MTKTTHRPSFKSYCDPNSFYAIAPDGTLTFDGEPMAYTPDWVARVTAQHDRDGSHPDCVICQANARQYWQEEADAQAADARDLLDTYRSAL